jgi:hypothetical protein
MTSLQNIPYDLLLSIAHYLDLVDIYALQLVRTLIHSYPFLQMLKRYHVADV